MERPLYNSPLRNSSQDFFGGAAPEKDLSIRGNVSPVQFRNVNVGMFSGRRPSYQRYSASPMALDAVTRASV